MTERKVWIMAMWIIPSAAKVYESPIDNNTYSPSAYPAGWKEITE